ncbi:MAG TPA: class I SAM-dependent methyltransferase, partial [Aquirhabdus sp.]
MNTDDYVLVLEEQAETPTARELRKQPELGLIYDAQGLWLAANGMKMQPDWVGQLPRLYRAGIRNELLARACLISSTANIVDATAGLGHDALLLAW